MIKQVWNKVVVDESGDLVQNIMWLAFIALACIVAIGALGDQLKGVAGNATTKLQAISAE